MNRTTKTVLTVVGIILLVYVWGECRAKQGAEEQRLRDEGRIADSVARATDLLREHMAQQDSVRAAHEFGGGAGGMKSPSAPAITVISPATTPESLVITRRGISSSHSIVKYGSTALSARGRLSQI